MPVNHNYVSTAPAVSGKVDSTEWNRAHDVALVSGDLDPTFLLLPSKGGTGVANADASTLTLDAATSITGGGTLALGGFTATVPATLTVAGLGIANVFTTQQMVDGTSDQIQLRIQGHSTQTANIQTWEKSDNTVYSYVSLKGAHFGNGGTYNEIVGYQAGNSLSLGSFPGGDINTLFGYQAGYGLNNTSYNNVAIGTQALYVGGGSTNCMAFGPYALKNNTGVDNVGIGQGAGLWQGTGGRNVYIGSAAGYGDSAYNASYQIKIGFYAGYKTTTSNVLIIDSVTNGNTPRASAAQEATNAIIYGLMGLTPSVQTLALNAITKVAVNTTTTNAPLVLFDLNAYVSTAATGFANGGGVAFTMTGETATDGTSQLMAQIASSWVDATNATRKATLSLYAYEDRKSVV